MTRERKHRPRVAAAGAPDRLRQPTLRPPTTSPPSAGRLAPTSREPTAAATVSAGVQTVAVTSDEVGMRVDRFLEARFPGLSFSHIQRIIRKGELRVNGKRAQPKDRLQAGQAVRIPPL